MNNSELEALISLLDDTDKEVYTAIEDKLMSIGKDVIPVLEDVWSNSFDNLIQERIENIIHRIQFESLKNDLKYWLIQPDRDIIEGCILVARYQYPDIDAAEIRKQIEIIRKDAWIEMNDRLTALEQIKVLNHVFFDIHGFSGNTANFHAPQNSYINTVLETRKGNPLMMSILYAYIANTMHIPIYGVNLPEHFVLVYFDGEYERGKQEEDIQKVLFYINPFSKGSVFSKKEIDSFLKQINLERSSGYYLPCSDTASLKRMFSNLIHSYQKLGYAEKVAELEELKSVLENND
jgi:regulator of sirC expression with transglutaminase-like and TPR domain